jgi:hypothetical protein
MLVVRTLVDYYQRSERVMLPIVPTASISAPASTAVRAEAKLKASACARLQPPVLNTM